MIIYSQQVSIFMKQPCSIHNRFCSAKNKEVVRVRLELTTLTLLARLRDLSKKKRSCLCEVRTHDLRITARRSTTQKQTPYVRTMGPKGNKVLTSHKWTS